MTSLTKTTVVIATTLGNIILTIRADAAPITASHFQKVVNSQLYTGCCFYRSDFVIQMGLINSTTGDKVQNPHPDLARNETNDNVVVSNTRGTMSIAHWDVPDCGNSTAFINLDANVHLDEAYGGYCVFAQIDPTDQASFQVVDAIAKEILKAEGTVVPIQSVSLS